MIDDNKIEAAKEEIYEDRFLLNGEEIVFNNDEKEEMFYKEDIKEAIGLGAYHPLGFMTQTDAHYLFDKVFTKEFVKEMTDRGYDVRTMKFEISPKLPNYERFNGLSEKYYGKKK